MGARRTWRLFGWGSGSSNGVEADDADASGFESGPLHPGMLESLSRESGGSVPEPVTRTAAAAAASPESGFESGPLHPGMLESLSLESGDAASPRPPDRKTEPEGPQRPTRTTRSESDQGFESGPLHPGMLQSMALEAGEGAEAADAGPSHPSLLALDPSARPEPLERPGSRFFAQPLIEHSILDELAGFEERPVRTWPIERAILISIIAHIALVLILMFMPAKTPNPKGGILDAFLPKNQPESPIPISFPDLPGPARANPRPRAPLSDAARRAGGRDPSKPKAETPYIPPRNGIAGLAPGPRAPRIPGSQVPARPGARAEAERRPAAEPQPPQTAEKNQPSEFPTSDRPQTGPKSDTKLTGLDQAIRE